MTVRVLGRSPSHARPERLGTTNDDAAYDLLTSAVWYIDATNPGTQGVTVPNLGTGGSALDAQYGSTTGADTNDPKWLGYEGTPYVYVPGSSGNYLSVPHSAALDITGDIDIRVKVALDDWTSDSYLVTKTGAAGNLGYSFRTLASGQLRLAWNVDGTSAALFSDSTVAPTVSDGGTLWVRATLDVDNGAGGYDVKFYTSADGVTWTQLGSTVTGGSTTTQYASTNALRVGHAGSGTAYPAAGKFYRAIVKNGIDGVAIADIDTSVVTSGSATSFTALTGQTVTINRSTSGRKSAVVTAPCWLFGTDDYLTVADNALINFNASDDLTMFAAYRIWNTKTAAQPILVKDNSNSTASVGWSLETGSRVAAMIISDGTIEATAYDATSVSFASGALTTSAGVRDAGSTITTYVNGVGGTPVTDTTGDLTNASVPLNVGKYAASIYIDGIEFYAAAVFRRALTAGEVAVLSAYFAGRCR